jgi:hypothetical protein
MLNKLNDSIGLFYSKNKEIVIILFFAFFYRLFLYLFLYDNATIENDSGTYQYLAQKITNFDLLGYNGERTPGYPLLLFLAFNSVKVAVFYQYILGISTAIIWYKTILNFNFSKKNSLWITLFLQSFLNIFFYESAILVETLSLFFLSIVFYLISNNYLENQRFKIDLLMSLLLGYLTLIKPFFAFIPFLLYGFIVLNNFNFKRIINRRIIILLFSVVSYFGWSYVNKINTESFTSTTFLGYNLAQNCVYFAEKGPKEYSWIYEPYAKYRDQILAKDKNQSAAMAIWDTYTSGVYNYKKLSFADLSNEFGKYATETIKNNPKDYFKQVITKSWLYFWRPNIAMDINRLETKNKQTVFTAIWFIQRKFFNIFKYGFILLVPFYTYRFFKNKKITNEFVLVTIIFATSVLQGLITYGTNARYSFAFEYVMILIGLLFIKNHIKLPKFLSTYLQ